MRHKVHNTLKAARREASVSRTGRLLCKFPRNDYKTAHGTKVKSPTRSLTPYTDGVGVLVRFDRAWWRVTAETLQLTDGGRLMRWRDGRVARASLFFRAVDIVTPDKTPKKIK